MDTLGKRIKFARNACGLKQHDVSNHFGIARVNISQWESDTTKPDVDRMSSLAAILNTTTDWLLTGSGEPPTLGTKSSSLLKEKPNAIIGDKIEGNNISIPVYGQAVGGIDGEFIMNGTILFEVLAPPQIAKIAGAYGVLISGDSMFPRYEDGEIAFIDPRRRIKKGDYVVAQIQVDENEVPHAFVKRFVRHNAEELVLSQFNPPKELTFDHESVVSVHFIALAGVA
ncbi:MAG: putative transcriptional regulator [Caudoviricetes sp.]|nr:MAG: putative transcriptional regulator [Caudoviricetes sp.]